MITARLTGGPHDGFTDRIVDSEHLPQLVTVRFCDGCKRRHLFEPLREVCEEATYLLERASSYGHHEPARVQAEYRYVSVDRAIQQITDRERLTSR